MKNLLKQAFIAGQQCYSFEDWYAEVKQQLKIEINQSSLTVNDMDNLLHSLRGEALPAQDEGEFDWPSIDEIQDENCDCVSCDRHDEDDQDVINTIVDGEFDQRNPLHDHDGDEFPEKHMNMGSLFDEDLYPDGKDFDQGPIDAMFNELRGQKPS